MTAAVEAAFADAKARAAEPSPETARAAAATAFANAQARAAEQVRAAGAAVFIEACVRNAAARNRKLTAAIAAYPSVEESTAASAAAFSRAAALAAAAPKRNLDMKDRWLWWPASKSWTISDGFPVIGHYIVGPFCMTYDMAWTPGFSRIMTNYVHNVFPCLTPSQAYEIFNVMTKKKKAAFYVIWANDFAKTHAERQMWYSKANAIFETLDGKVTQSI
jgi:hypothetical protein